MNSTYLVCQSQGEEAVTILSTLSKNAHQALYSAIKRKGWRSLHFEHGHMYVFSCHHLEQQQQHAGAVAAEKAEALFLAKQEVVSRDSDSPHTKQELAFSKLKAW
jgi:hypothetical protein